MFVALVAWCQVWEASASKGSLIGPDASRSLREAFIRSKYEQRAFLDPPIDLRYVAPYAVEAPWDALSLSFLFAFVYYNGFGVSRAGWAVVRASGDTWFDGSMDRWIEGLFIGNATRIRSEREAFAFHIVFFVCLFFASFVPFFFVLFGCFCLLSFSLFLVYLFLFCFSFVCLIFLVFLATVYAFSHVLDLS